MKAYVLQATQNYVPALEVAPESKRAIQVDLHGGSVKAATLLAPRRAQAKNVVMLDAAIHVAAVLLGSIAIAANAYQVHAHRRAPARSAETMGVVEVVEHVQEEKRVSTGNATPGVIPLVRAKNAAMMAVVGTVEAVRRTKPAQAGSAWGAVLPTARAKNVVTTVAAVHAGLAETVAHVWPTSAPAIVLQCWRAA